MYFWTSGYHQSRLRSPESKNFYISVFNIDPYICSCVCVDLKVNVHLLSFFKCVIGTKYQHSNTSRHTGKQFPDALSLLQVCLHVMMSCHCANFPQLPVQCFYSVGHKCKRRLVDRRFHTNMAPSLFCTAKTTWISLKIEVLVMDHACPSWVLYIWSWFYSFKKE